MFTPAIRPFLALVALLAAPSLTSSGPGGRIGGHVRDASGAPIANAQVLVIGTPFGQGPLLPVMPAVANAVYDAVGVRVDEVPITPEKVLKALRKKRKGEEARVGPSAFPDIPWPEPSRVPPPWEGGDGKAIDQAPTLAGGVREERQH